MATSGGKRREEGSDNSDDELTPLANDIYGGRYVLILYYFNVILGAYDRRAYCVFGKWHKVVK